MDGNTRWIKRAAALSWFTVIYNLAEGLVSVYFGFAADSIALFGFGLDSFVEMFSAAAVLWRFNDVIHSKEHSLEREK